MRSADMASTLIRPAISGTIRARQTKKEQRAVTTKQWLGYIAVAAATTWLTKVLDDLIEHHLGAQPHTR